MGFLRGEGPLLEIIMQCLTELLNMNLHKRNSFACKSICIIIIILSSWAEEFVLVSDKYERLSENNWIDVAKTIIDSR